MKALPLRKILAVLLALIMAAGLLPVTAKATDTPVVAVKAFEFIDAGGTPVTTVYKDLTYTVRTTVTNTGTVDAASIIIQLVLRNVPPTQTRSDQQTIALAAGASHTYTYSWTPSQTGQWMLSLNATLFRGMEQLAKFPEKDYMK